MLFLEVNQLKINQKTVLIRTAFSLINRLIIKKIKEYEGIHLSNIFRRKLTSLDYRLCKLLNVNLLTVQLDLNKKGTSRHY